MWPDYRGAQRECLTTMLDTYFDLISPLFGPVNITVKNCASTPRRVAMPSCDAGPGLSESVAVNDSTSELTGSFSSIVGVYSAWSSTGLKKLSGDTIVIDTFTVLLNGSGTPLSMATTVKLMTVYSK